MDQPNKIIEDLMKTARAAAKIDRERIEAFEKLIALPGWSVYVELLNAKIQMMADEMMKASGSLDGLIGQEYVKGTLSGLIIARDIPSAMIAAKDQIRSMSPEEDEDANDS